jgi:hypothetical protein
MQQIMEGTGVIAINRYCTGIFIIPGIIHPMTVPNLHMEGTSLLMEETRGIMQSRNNPVKADPEITDRLNKRPDLRRPDPRLPDNFQHRGNGQLRAILPREVILMVETGAVIMAGN